MQINNSTKNELFVGFVSFYFPEPYNNNFATQS